MNFYLDYLLGLPEVSVSTCTQVQGNISLSLEILANGISCPHCGTHTEQVHQNRPMLVRDLPSFGRVVYLKVPRRQFYCAQCQRYSTESLDFIDWRRRHTRRYEEQIYERVQQSSLEQIGREEGMSYDEIKGIFDHVHTQRKKKIQLR